MNIMKDWLRSGQIGPIFPKLTKIGYSQTKQIIRQNRGQSGDKKAGTAGTAGVGQTTCGWKKKTYCPIDIGHIVQ